MSETIKPGQGGQETRWRKPQKVIVCEILGEGILCPRNENLQGMCGTKGSKDETFRAKHKRVDVGDGYKIQGCPVAANYLLQYVSEHSKGGKSTFYESRDGKQLKVESIRSSEIFPNRKRRDIGIVNNGMIEFPKQ